MKNKTILLMASISALTSCVDSAEPPPQRIEKEVRQPASNPPSQPSPAQTPAQGNSNGVGVPPTNPWNQPPQPVAPQPNYVSYPY